MKTSFFISLLTALLVVSCQTSAPTGEHPFLSSDQISAADPAELYGGLFERVQLAPVFSDSKEFVDRIPRTAPEKILAADAEENPRTREELTKFVDRHFEAPAAPVAGSALQTGLGIDEHIRSLWKTLTRNPDEEPSPATSLIPLPHPYVVPGGRFREIYYWDSYFTQLGLLADGEDLLFQNMVRNFAHLIHELGHIPNGNRDYYRGRSQPPYFSLMVSLWDERFGVKSALEFLPALRKEHEFWMKGQETLALGEAKNRVVRVGEKEFLNRYWDDKPAPRPEAFKEDRHLAQEAQKLGRSPEEVYRDLRAGAESGWDYSTRWFAKPTDFASIQTSSFLPVDLNALLFHLESKIADLSAASGNEAEARRFRELAENRRLLLRKYFWKDSRGTYFDWNWKTKEASASVNAAMSLPLFVGAASNREAKQVAKVLEQDLLRAGGIVTTPVVSGQQWDAPNGWAPLQWTAYAGLRRYGQTVLAEKIRTRWLRLNRKVFQATGKMMEKYNVVDLSLESGGGEYPLQDGFGWTNGVYRAFQKPDAVLKHLLRSSVRSKSPGSE